MPDRKPKRLIFIGECRSLTAIRNGWSWEDGRLAAKPLFEALVAMGLDPAAQEYANLFEDPSPTSRRSRKRTTTKVCEGIVSGLLVLETAIQDEDRAVIVALGQRVSRELAARGIEHVALVHPAARGRIRKRARYIRHVAERLAGSVAA